MRFMNVLQIGREASCILFRKGLRSTIEGNTEVWLKVGSPVAFVEAGGEVYKN